MDSTQRTQIILAAVSAAGPSDGDESAWSDRVSALAASITAMTDERSSVSAVVEGVSNAKVFTATVLGGKKEASSNRWVVSMKTKPSTFHPDGLEDARTERAENGGLAMANRVRGLVGHKVAIWIEVQTYDNGSGKVRVIRHIQDLGVAEVEVNEQKSA